MRPLDGIASFSQLQP